MSWPLSGLHNNEEVTNTCQKEGKPREVIVLKNGFSQSATFKHIDKKLIGMKKCGRKREHSQTTMKTSASKCV